MLLSKTFGQQANSDQEVPRRQREARGPADPPGMVGRWFFMIIGTIFCITPAFVYWLAG